MEPEDLELLYKWENDPANWFVSNNITPWSRYSLKKYLESASMDIHKTGQLRLMIEARNQENGKWITAGTIDMFDFEPYHSRAGVGILMADTENRKKGFASEALQLFIGYAFDLLHLHQLYCNIAGSNTASLNLFRKHGFENAGIKKEWLKTGTSYEDEYTLQLINPASPA